jgi:hypothetical protein
MNDRDVGVIPYPEGCALRFLKSMLPAGSGKRMRPASDVPLPGRHPGKRTVTVDTEGTANQKALFKELLDIPYVWIYLHGSRADNTATSFSDYDDLIIIDLERLSGSVRCSLARKLIRVDKRFRRLDPLQHHGHWIISKQSLMNYDASYIPLHILHTAVRIQGPETIEYTPDKIKTQRGLYRNIEQTCLSIRECYALYKKNRITTYRLKGLVGSFALMPAFLFQYLGEEVDKRTAILRAGELFGTDAIECLKWSTEYRNSWDLVLKPALRSRYFTFLATVVPNPHLYRKIAHRLAPYADVTRHGLPMLGESHVHAFIDESISHLA